MRRTPNQTDSDVTCSRSCDQGKITKQDWKINGRLIDFLSQISKLSHFNLLDGTFWCITSIRFRFLMWQPWVTGVGRGQGAPIPPAPLDFEIFRKKVDFLVLSGKNKFHHFWSPLEKFWKKSFRRPCPGCVLIQANTFSVPLLLFDETFAQPDVFAVVNYPVVALCVLLRCFMCSLNIQCLESWTGLM